jgi:hypothetical protein
MRQIVTQISASFVLGVCALGGLTGAIARATDAPNEVPPSPLTVGTDGVAQTPTPPPVPPQPNPVPASRVPATTGIMGVTPATEDDIGVGHLRPQDLSFLENPDEDDNASLLGVGWLQSAAIPIYIEPDGAHWGWIINGWLVPNGQSPIALGEDASFLMWQTYPNLMSFPVTQLREDGWFQFQYTPAGTAWAHVEHLDLGVIDLEIEPWEGRFAEVEQVAFRQHGLSKSLYSVPGNDRESILGLVGPNSLIQPLAFEGDWMLVTVTQPTDGCSAFPGASTQEGWMRWRNDDQGALIWFDPQGC